MGNENTKQQKQPITKKLVNDPITCVKDSLYGYVLTHKNVKLLQDFDVVVRHDIEDLKKSGKVALITGMLMYS